MKPYDFYVKILYNIKTFWDFTALSTLQKYSVIIHRNDVKNNLGKLTEN